MPDDSTNGAGNNLDALLITECPAAFVPLALKHNALVRLVASISGLRVSALNGYVDPSYIVKYSPVTSVAGKTGDIVLEALDIIDFDSVAASAAPVQSVAGKTGTVTLTAPTDISSFNTAAAAAAPVQSVSNHTGNVSLAWVDISDAEVRANSAAANYVANYTNENVFSVCVSNVATSVTFITKA